MPENIKQKRFRLLPTEYDEVSLVDSGANQHADIVLSKRDEVEKVISTSGGGTKAPSGGGGTTQRASNWQPTRHPRNAIGEWATTSQQSKLSYGKGGTAFNNKPRGYKPPKPAGGAKGGKGGSSAAKKKAAAAAAAKKKAAALAAAKKKAAALAAKKKAAALKAAQKKAAQTKTVRVLGTAAPTSGTGAMKTGSQTTGASAAGAKQTPVAITRTHNIKVKKASVKKMAAKKAPVKKAFTGLPTRTMASPGHPIVGNGGVKMPKIQPIHPVVGLPGRQMPMPRPPRVGVVRIGGRRSGMPRMGLGLPRMGGMGRAGGTKFKQPRVGNSGMPRMGVLTPKSQTKLFKAPKQKGMRMGGMPSMGMRMPVMKRENLPLESEWPLEIKTPVSKKSGSSPIIAHSERLLSDWMGLD